MLWQVLACIYATRNGLSEAELQDIVPDLAQSFWSAMCYCLHQYHILTSVAGLLVLANDQVCLPRFISFYYWRRFGSVGNVVGRMKKVNQRRARLVLGWVTVCRRVNHLSM